MPEQIAGWLFLVPGKRRHSAYGHQRIWCIPSPCSRNDNVCAGMVECGLCDTQHKEYVVSVSAAKLMRKVAEFYLHDNLIRLFAFNLAGQQLYHVV